MLREFLNDWKDIPSILIEIFTSHKMKIVPKLAYRFKIVSIKIPVGLFFFLAEIDEMKQTQCCKSTLFQLKYHRIVCFKQVNYMICNICLSKVTLKNILIDSILSNVSLCLKNSAWSTYYIHRSIIGAH